MRAVDCGHTWILDGSGRPVSVQGKHMVSETELYRRIAAGMREVDVLSSAIKNMKAKLKELEEES